MCEQKNDNVVHAVANTLQNKPMSVRDLVYTENLCLPRTEEATNWKNLSTANHASASPLVYRCELSAVHRSRLVRGSHKEVLEDKLVKTLKRTTPFQDSNFAL